MTIILITTELVELIKWTINGSLPSPQRESLRIPRFVVPPLIIDSEVAEVLSEEAGGGSLIVVVVVLLWLLGKLVFLEAAAGKLVSA